APAEVVVFAGVPASAEVVVFAGVPASARNFNSAGVLASAGSFNFAGIFASAEFPADDRFQSVDEDRRHGGKISIEFRQAPKPDVDGGVPVHFVEKDVDAGLDDADDELGRVCMEKLAADVPGAGDDLQI